MDSTTTHISRESTKANYDLLVDISIPIALACFLPLLETVHCLVKFSQEHDIFICDYLATVKGASCSYISSIKTQEHASDLMHLGR
jgi:hypothetical protein